MSLIKGAYLVFYDWIQQVRTKIRQFSVISKILVVCVQLLKELLAFKAVC
jgi:hypothetical protein